MKNDETTEKASENKNIKSFPRKRRKQTRSRMIAARGTRKASRNPRIGVHRIAIGSSSELRTNNRRRTRDKRGGYGNLMEE